MQNIQLKCRKCGANYPAEQLYECSLCGGALEVDLDYSQIESFSFGDPFKRMWGYESLLPNVASKNIVSLGEGFTPLLESSSLTDKWGINASLYIKAESLNPTGSFKDRPTSVGVSVAKELGARSIVVASSGNAAASAAAYAAAAGLPCYVIVPDSTDISKVQQALAYGATLFSVPGTYSDAFAFTKVAAETFGFANVTSTYVNPYTVEGDKTIAYELVAQLKQVPDYILVPIGSGPLLTGVLKGFKEMLHFKAIDRLPKMIGVQAAECAPIVNAFNENRPTAEWDASCETIATGIADPLSGYTGDGDYTLKSVADSNGLMVSISEDIIQSQLSLIEKTTGIYCEPAGSVSVSAVPQLFKDGKIEPGSLVVSLMTGSGFKFSHRKLASPIHIKSFDELKQHISSGN